MVLDWMLLFFKQLTTNQYMDQGELYQQNWCSIVGGVLDWMLFFSKHWQLVSTWMMDRIILKIIQSRSGVPLWEVFLIGCYSFSNVQQPVSTWMMDSIIPKTTVIKVKEHGKTEAEPVSNMLESEKLLKSVRLQQWICCIQEVQMSRLRANRLAKGT